MFRRASILLLILFLLVSCSIVDLVNNNPTVEPPAQPTEETIVPVTATVTIAPTETVAPISEPTQTITPTEVVTQTIPVPEAPQYVQKQVAEPKYIIQPGTPVTVANFAQSEDGCNWMGIGGQVFTSAGEPVTNLVIDIEGKLDVQDVLYLAISGTAQQIGPGGFLIKFADHPIASDGTMFLQVFDLQGSPQSDQIPLTTYANCEQNMILLNLVALEKKVKIYLPSIYGENAKNLP